MGYRATTEGEEALAAATAETVILLIGNASLKGVIDRIGFGFDGVTSTAEPVQWKLKRGNSASQGTSTASTEEKDDPDDPAALCAAFKHFTAEPTYTGVALDHGEVHPQGGWLWVPVFIVLAAATNSMIGLELTAPATVNVAAGIHWHEGSSYLIGAAR